jgi:hypothetical protein
MQDRAHFPEWSPGCDPVSAGNMEERYLRVNEPAGFVTGL